MDPTDSLLSNDLYKSNEKLIKDDPDLVSLNYKIMAVNLAKAHLKWNMNKQKLHLA